MEKNQIDGLHIYRGARILKNREREMEAKAGTYADDWWHIAILAHFASSQWQQQHTTARTQQHHTQKTLAAHWPAKSMAFNYCFSMLASFDFILDDLFALTVDLSL